MVELSKKQIEELARALIQGKRPFLWVITDKPNREAKIDGEEEIEMEKIAALRHELEEVGMIVTWCSQVEVLRHRSVGCLEQVMEENKAKELRGNAEKWKRLAVGEGGSLDKNTVAFVKEILSEAKGKG